MASRSSESVSFEPRDVENQRLREENAGLRRVLAAHGIPVPQFTPDDARPVQTITPAAVESKEERARKRIALFRNLFRGRDDVYARRWENPDGRSGYAPAALKNWRAINSSRPEDRKKVDRNTRKFLPLSDMVIENHLLGAYSVDVGTRLR
ncbi:MAG: TOTE conflict system archaeo-eukaryotic primase domain-containing protein [Acidobacteriaceae bacterium]